ncbi:MAG TPA: APC family permease [Acidimicrobiales bacterium]|nr:APC family permease [Acidimicrobiales bacterium]
MALTKAAEAAEPMVRAPGLRSDALGLPTVLAQSVALISPTMTAVLIVPLAFADAGQGSWLAYLFGTVMLLFVVRCLNQFARRSAAPGSMYSYTARGLGSATGVFSGWTLMWCYLFIGTAGLTGFAIFAQQFLDGIGVHANVPPVLFFLTSAAMCWFVAYKDIRISSLLTLFIEALSMTCILMLSAVVLFRHGFHVDTDQLALKGMSFHGLSLGVVISIFSLVGFESATALGGEAKKPLVNVPKAVRWSLIISGSFFVILSYVEVSGTRHYTTSLANLSAPLNVLSQLYGVSFFKVPLSLCAMVSFFSLTLSCLNAGARIIYPMAQHRVLPPALGRTHHINRTPHMAVTVYMAIVVSVPVVLEVFTDPLTIFGDAGTLAAFGFLLAYFLITVAAPVYLKKTGQLRRSDLVMAVAAFVLLLVPTEGSFYPVPAWPVDLFPYIFVAYVAVGAVWLYVAARRRPGILGEIAADLEAKEPQSATVIAPIEDPLTVAAVTRAPASGLEPAV